MENQFIEKELGECLELVIDHRGKTPKKLGADWVPSGVPTISAKNVNGGRLVATEDIRYVSHDVYKRWMKEDVKRGDCFLVSEGATLGECMMWDYDYPIVLGQRIFCLRANPTVLNPRYLYAYMTSACFQSEIIGRATGTSVDGLRQTEVLKLKLRLPPLPLQRQIGDTLYNLDTKIELNRRMNATLEAMARALFQSWFVDFDPVRAKLDGRPPAALDPDTAAFFPDSFEDPDLGHIPKGWKVGRLGQYLATEIGGDWGEDDRFEGAVEVAALRGVDLEHLRERGDANPPRRWIKESSLTKRRMSACDVLVASSGAGPCGRPLWVSPHLEAAFSVPVLYSNFCKRYRAATPAHALYFDRVLFEMRASGEIWDFINGTSLPNLDSNGLMTGKSVLVPPVKILEKFAEFVQPIYERLYSRESRTLATLRETLLPKLLSGEFRVAVAEIPVDSKI